MSSVIFSDIANKVFQQVVNNLSPFCHFITLYDDNDDLGSFRSTPSKILDHQVSVRKNHDNPQRVHEVLHLGRAPPHLPSRRPHLRHRRRALLGHEGGILINWVHETYITYDS